MCCVDGCRRKKHLNSSMCSRCYDKARGTCSVTGCDRGLHSHGFCYLHYRYDRKKAPCKIEGCDNKSNRRGLCTTHYAQHRGNCTVPGCDGGNHGRGLCRRHNEQSRKGRPFTENGARTKLSLDQSLILVQTLVEVLPTILGKLNAHTGSAFDHEELEKLRFACGQLKARSWTIQTACRRLMGGAGTKSLPHAIENPEGETENV